MPDDPLEGMDDHTRDELLDLADILGRPPGAKKADIIRLILELVEGDRPTSALLGPDGAPLADREGNKAVLWVKRKFDDGVMELLGRDPSKVYGLSPREFEELICEIFSRDGYSVELTAASRDGGIDLWACKKELFGSFVLGVECKRYGPDHPVGVGVIRAVHGAVQASDRSSVALVATTSRFTADAVTFRDSISAEMNLADFGRLAQWLAPFRGDG